MTLGRIRWLLARKLVGRFVQVPDRDGVFIVIQEGPVQATYSASKFRMKSRLMPLRDYASFDDMEYERRRSSVSTFVGTIER